MRRVPSGWVSLELCPQPTACFPSGQVLPGLMPRVWGSKGLCFRPLAPPSALVTGGIAALGGWAAGSVPSIVFPPIARCLRCSVSSHLCPLPLPLTPLVLCFPVLLSPGLLSAAPSLLPFPPTPHPQE